MATAAAAPPLSPIKGQQCVHGVRDNGKLCKQCPGPGICRTTLSQKQYCKCEDEKCGSALCPHKRSKYKCKHEDCRRTATQICPHGRNKYDCLEGACPGTSTCKHGRNRASRCVDCQAEKLLCEPCEEPQTSAQPPAKKARRFYGSSHCPGVMWPMGPRIMRDS